MGGAAMNWEPAKIRFDVLIIFIVLMCVAAIIYNLLVPTLEECLLEQANENISSACWDVLRTQGKI